MKLEKGTIVYNEKFGHGVLGIVDGYAPNGNVYVTVETKEDEICTNHAPWGCKPEDLMIVLT